MDVWAVLLLVLVGTLLLAGLIAGLVFLILFVIRILDGHQGGWKRQTFNVNDLTQVRELATKLGGIDKLKETVAALDKLQSIWFGV